MASDIENRLEVATQRAENGSDIIYRVANEGEGTYVPTDSGDTPTIKTFLEAKSNVIDFQVSQFLTTKDTEVNEGVNSLLQQSTTAANSASSSATSASLSAQEAAASADQLNIFQSIGEVQISGLLEGTIARVWNGLDYDIKTADGSESFLLNNGRGAFVRKASAENIDWDFEVVFNDGVELRSGYGTRNIHGNKAADFSRASASGNINKSEVIETVAVDDPCIASSGLSIYESYINYFSTPQSPATQVCTIPSGDYTLWVLGSGSATASYGVATEGSPLTFTSAGEALTVTITGSVTLCNLIDLYKIAPPILTASAPASRSSDIASIPMMNNMPASGKPFTIFIKSALPISDNDPVSLIRNGLTASSGFFLDRPSASLDLIRIGMTDKHGVTAIFQASYPDVNSSEFEFKFDGSKISLFANRTFIGSANCDGATYDLTSTIDIGRRNNSTAYLNSSIEYCRITHQ